MISKLRTLQPKVVDIDCMPFGEPLRKTATKQFSLEIDDHILLFVQMQCQEGTGIARICRFCDTKYKSILKHCEMRWLSLRRSIQRTIHMWEPLCSYFQSHCEVDKPGKVRTINGILHEPQTKLWLCLLSNILAAFNKLNVFFETSSTSTTHKLHGENKRLLKTVLYFFIKPCILLQNSADLTAINYLNRENLLSQENIFVSDVLY